MKNHKHVFTRHITLNDPWIMGYSHEVTTCHCGYQALDGTPYTHKVVEDMMGRAI